MSRGELGRFPVRLQGSGAGVLINAVSCSPHLLLCSREEVGRRAVLGQPLCRRGCAGHTHFFDPGARGTILKGLRVLAHGVLTSWSLLSPPMTPPILLCTLRSETVRQRENQGRWADPGMRSSSVPQSTDSLFKKGKSDG